MNYTCQYALNNSFRYIGGMDDVADRLVKARKAAGYSSASSAARAMGAPVPTYIAHENPNNVRGLSRSADRYAAFFRVSLEWLLTGKGDMFGNVASIPITGFVGAGSGVEPIGDTSAADAPYSFDLPESQSLAGLIVRGESQWPRYLDGELIFYETKPRTPRELANTYAVIDLDDGRRMIKMLRQGRKIGTWIMESHNANPEETDAITAVYKVRGTLAR